MSTPVISEERRPFYRVHSEGRWEILPLTAEQVVAVELATKGERYGGMRWPRGWQHSFGKPESWRWPDMLTAERGTI
jgi:hypothetical protein